MYNRCFQCLNELAIVSPFKFVDRASYLTFVRVNWVILASVNQYRLSFTVDKCFLARYLIPTRTKESVYVSSAQTRLVLKRFSNILSSDFFFFLAFDLCRFCVVIRHRHNGQWPPTSKDFYTRSYPLHYFLILFLEKEPVFPFSMLSAKQVKYWYHFYNVFGMTRTLTGDWNRDLPHSMPAL